ncbi:Nucleophile aminohydrolase, N-terminal [Trema orientale]|uniref:Nucleophile aminohydrolase, N-terminal n=1 Tax=Trema orientale TaxID=63057 RepID=A0A2P5EIE2_TREOI|nr:Nucleophile aminohydrolase, N-terminal [Trema orientale]
MLTNILYLKQWFVCHSYHIFGSYDEKGYPFVHICDPLNFHQRVAYGAKGSGGTHILAILKLYLRSAVPLPLPTAQIVVPTAVAQHPVPALVAQWNSMQSLPRGTTSNSCPGGIASYPYPSATTPNPYPSGTASNP